MADTPAPATPTGGVPFATPTGKGTPLPTPPRPVAPGAKPDRVLVYTRVRPPLDPSVAEGTPGRDKASGAAGAPSAVRVDVEACQARVRGSTRARAVHVAALSARH